MNGFVQRTAICLAWMVCVALSRGAWLKWDYNVAPDVAGYRVHVGTNSRIYTFTLDVGKTNRWLISRLKIPMGRTNFFAVTAYNSAGANSKLSAEAFTNWTSTAVSPITSVTLRVPPGKFYVERADATTAWLAMSVINGPTNMSFPIPKSGTMGFFRFKPYFVSAVNPKSGKLVPPKAAVLKPTKKSIPVKATPRIAPGSVNLDPSKR